jgi:hypothetical protein
VTTLEAVARALSVLEDDSGEVMSKVMAPLRRLTELQVLPSPCFSCSIMLQLLRGETHIGMRSHRRPDPGRGLVVRCFP